MGSQAEAAAFTSGPYKCGHRECYDDDGHTDGCHFAESDGDVIAAIVDRLPDAIVTKAHATEAAETIVRTLHERGLRIAPGKDADVLDAITQLYRQPVWKVDGSASSFIEAVADELRAVRTID